MKIGRRLLKELKHSLKDIHTNLDIMDDTFGYSSYPEDIADGGIAANLREIREAALNIQDILDDQPTDEE